MSEQTLQKFYEVGDRIRHVMNELDRLSNAFYVTGNNKICEDLNAMSIDLEKANKRLNEAVSEDINERLGEARKGAAETLGLVLRMAERVGEVGKGTVDIMENKEPV